MPYVSSRRSILVGTPILHLWSRPIPYPLEDRAFPANRYLFEPVCPLPLSRIPLSPLHSSLLNYILTEMPEAIPPLKTGFHQCARINQPPRYCLHNLENLYRITHAHDLFLANFENCERDTENGLTAFVEKRIPDSENAFDRQCSDETGHEPCGGT